VVLAILFWAWNVLDARRLALGRPETGAGILLAAVILYVVAWNVTDVKLDRLVARRGCEEGRSRSHPP
jgi:hypothetical protein